MKKKYLNFLFVFFIFSFLFFISDPILAQSFSNMRSPDYELVKPNLNFSSAYVTGSSQKLGFTGGQLSPGAYSTTGFYVWGGFWYLKKRIPFTFTISNNTIEFGELSTNTPEIGSSTVTISCGSAGGYQVTVQENHQLMVYSTGAIIKDVTGDNNDITESNAGNWTLSSTDGFGYSLSGDDVPPPFPTRNPLVTPTLTSFKQFTDLSKSETPQVIMSSQTAGENRTLDLFYKINIGPFQEAGRYQNVITYIATPTY